MSSFLGTWTNPSSWGTCHMNLAAEHLHPCTFSCQLDICFICYFSVSFLFTLLLICKHTFIHLFCCFLHPSPQTTKCTSGIGVVNFLLLSSQGTHAPLTVWAGTRPSQASWLPPQTMAQYVSGVLHPSSTRKRRMDSTVIISTVRLLAAIYSISSHLLA